jgi:hypothetical protein
LGCTRARMRVGAGRETGKFSGAFWSQNLDAGA